MSDADVRDLTRAAAVGGLPEREALARAILGQRGADYPGPVTAFASLAPRRPASFRETLGAIKREPDGTKREGFPAMTGEEFVAMFCKHMKCDCDTFVTRIEFRRVGS